MTEPVTNPTFLEMCTAVSVYLLSVSKGTLVSGLVAHRLCVWIQSIPEVGMPYTTHPLLTLSLVSRRPGYAARSSPLLSSKQS